MIRLHIIQNRRRPVNYAVLSGSNTGLLSFDIYILFFSRYIEDIYFVHTG
jgi:hypothetical protein